MYSVNAKWLDDIILLSLYFIETFIFLVEHYGLPCDNMSNYFVLLCTYILFLWSCMPKTCSDTFNVVTQSLDV